MDGAMDLAAAVIDRDADITRLVAIDLRSALASEDARIVGRIMIPRRAGLSSSRLCASA